MFNIKSKAKGFTLMELILTIALFSMLLSFSLINMGGFSSIKNRIDVDLTGNRIINFINNSKIYCRDKSKKSGYIYFNVKDGIITFNSGMEEILKMELPEGFILNQVSNDNKIKIDNRGITADACSIKFKDRKGEIHCLTMCVGTSYVEFKY
ncbi:type II secretion system protein [Clostridium sp.]|jgi:prepilin-type N-terminal cleavage/methylation domain-containing protein|uniref:type II secretion system protein n=1 Tax=Clostridium sp. TaxID=1506 RepID=UPI002FDDA5A2